MMYDMSMTNAIAEPQPWVAWPAIAKAARANGWRVLAERRGVARAERRDPRSEVGAVTLHVEFNRAGHIAGAWIEELDRHIRSQPKKLNTILEWICEAVPEQRYGAERFGPTLTALLKSRFGWMDHSHDPRPDGDSGVCLCGRKIGENDQGFHIGVLGSYAQDEVDFLNEMDEDYPKSAAQLQAIEDAGNRF
ncbi:hypothetical protein OS121_28730 [Mycolicibacterium mucogenicum]|uniref:hypothetical protein n=1 Tax=Mycolicibacterium mucogenicum TaxID=56689 RepID=UPI002269BFFD|nr:hypothetical protein [Mycolicibacterium mucogenicum]MCX8559031.1 hypothetical protein [Mycolicibacterium mucogenicum]